MIYISVFRVIDVIGIFLDVRIEGNTLSNERFVSIMCVFFVYMRVNCFRVRIGLGIYFFFREFCEFI